MKSIINNFNKRFNINGFMLVIICLSVLLLNSCYKDKGNYDYKISNDVAIKSADTIVVSQGDQLKITPELEQRVAANESSLSFEWTLAVAGKTVADSTYQVLAKTRNLDISTIDFKAKRNYYTLNYRITNLETGVVYHKLIKLLVSTNFQTGWIILDQSGSSSDLNFVNDNQKAAYYKLFSKVNTGITLPLSAHHAYSFYVPEGLNPEVSLSAVISDNEGYLIDNGNFKILSNISSLFYTKPSVIKPEFMQQNLGNNLSLINNGKLYYMNTSAGSIKFGDEYKAYDGAGYSLAPQQFKSYAGSGVLFDNLNGRFLRDSYGSTTFVTPDRAFDASYTAFDPVNINSNHELLSIGSMGPSYYSTLLAIFKDNTDNCCYLYGMEGGNKPTLYKAIENSPNMYLSVGFAYAPARNQIYYAVGDILYQYDVLSNNSTIAYTFPSGEEVTALQTKNSESLAVATYSGSKGTVYTFDIEATGEVTFNSKYENFGKVKNINYRY